MMAVQSGRNCHSQAEHKAIESPQGVRSWWGAAPASWDSLTRETARQTTSRDPCPQTVSPEFARFPYLFMAKVSLCVCVALLSPARRRASMDLQRTNTLILNIHTVVHLYFFLQVPSIISTLISRHIFPPSFHEGVRVLTNTSRSDSTAWYFEESQFCLVSWDPVLRGTQRNEKYFVVSWEDPVLLGTSRSPNIAWCPKETQYVDTAVNANILTIAKN